MLPLLATLVIFITYVTSVIVVTHITSVTIITLCTFIGLVTSFTHVTSVTLLFLLLTLPIFYIIRVKSRLSVCLSAFHLMSRIVLSNRCAFGSVFGVTEALIIERLNNDAFEKFVRAIVSRLGAVEGRCVD